MNSKLPISMESISIKDMLVGDVKYTLPWGMYADRKGNLWLNDQYMIADEPHGTIEMRIERLEKGFKVWAVAGYTYSGTEPCYCGEFKPLTVVELK